MMQHNSKFHCTPRYIAPMLLLTGTLLATELAGSASLLAAPLQLAQLPLAQVRPPASPENILRFQRETQSRQSAERLVQRDLARFLNIRRQNVRILDIYRHAWPNDCLGLPQSNERCTEAQVQGWRITASAGSRTWTYRANDTGLQVRREPESIDNLSLLPPTSRDRILQVVARQFDVAVEQLRVADVEEQVWDGCLSIPALANEPCAMVGITGWRVVVTDGRSRWIYHTDYAADAVLLNHSESEIHQSRPLAPALIPFDEYPQEPRTPGLVFRSIARSSAEGDRVDVMLYDDGRIVSQSQQGQRETRIAQQQVEQFQQLLNDQQFDVFSGINYPSSSGSTNGMSTMLISPKAVVQYADSVQDRLPSALEQVIRSWNCGSLQAPTDNSHLNSTAIH